MSFSKVIGKKQCPKCASLGNDTRKDNLILYEGNSAHCFSCGYHVHGNQKIQDKIRAKVAQPVKHEYNIPVDATTSLPNVAIEWLRDYHLTLNDLIRNRIMWSDQMQWLIFPITHKSEICGFQARNFNKDKPYKWYTKFKKNDYVIEFGRGLRVVLVEDIVSAIRVSHHAYAIPLFGSLVNASLIQYLKEKNLPVSIWLDRDKAREAMQFAATLRSKGIPTNTIITNDDPKMYNSETIARYIDDKS